MLSRAALKTLLPKKSPLILLVGVFYNLKIANPEAINEDAFRAEFAKFKAAIQKLEPEQQKVEIMKAMKNASERLQLPVRLLLYVAYGKKGYENLLKEGRT